MDLDERDLMRALSEMVKLVAKHYIFFNKTQGETDVRKVATALVHVDDVPSLLADMEHVEHVVAEAIEALKKSQDELDAAFPYARSDEEKNEDVMVLMQRRFINT